MTIVRWITRAWILLLAVVYIVRMIRDNRHITDNVIPQQLVTLVRQAHSGEPFKTRMDIQVSPEMRDALCLPLTPQQLATMRAAGEGVYSRSVFCRLVSSRFKGGELSGVVWVSVKVHSRYSRNDLLFPDTELRIVVRNNGRKYPMEAWEVVSVEKVA